MNVVGKVHPGFRHPFWAYDGYIEGFPVFLIFNAV